MDKKQCNKRLILAVARMLILLRIAILAPSNLIETRSAINS